MWLRYIANQLFAIEWSREVHLLLAAWLETGNGVKSLVVYQCHVKRIYALRIAEAEIGCTSVTDGRLCGNLSFHRHSGVGSQHLHPLGSYVVVGFHRYSGRIIQHPVVILVHGVDRHQTVVDFLSLFFIVKVMVLARIVHDHHDAYNKQRYPSELFHTFYFRIYNIIMWAKLQKYLDRRRILTPLLQNLTMKVIQLIDILINFAPKSIFSLSYVTSINEFYCNEEVFD